LCSFGTLYFKHNNITLEKLTPWHKNSKKMNATFVEIPTWVKAHYAPPPNYSHKHKRICIWFFVVHVDIAFWIIFVHFKYIH
jgi:hypothetical protein